MNFWQRLEKPFTVMAPMEGVTDFAFREIIAEVAKPDVTFTEFTSTDGMFSGGKATVLRRLDFSEKQRPIVAQIWGSKPEKYFKAAKLIKELNFDGIDINMGCPDKAVVKHGAGAALINNPSLVHELLQAIREGVGNLPISVKTRLGYDSIITKEWFPFLLEQDLAAIAIHARTAVAQSTGDAHWDEIGKIVKLRDQIAPQTIIIGNGDVMSYCEVLNRHEKYGVDGVMIGRGVFANPWVFQKDLDPSIHSIKEHLDLLLKHALLFTQKWGSSKSFEIMKKYFKIYVKAFPGADELRQQLMECRNYEEVRKTILRSSHYH